MRRQLYLKPISVQIEGFKQGVNYLELSSRSAHKELPDCITDLQKKKTINI